MLKRAFACFTLIATASSAAAWDYAAHRVVNLLALDGLPREFPAFVREAGARERIAFLSGEADRWRNVSDLTLRHTNSLDHYIDIEYIADAGLDASQLSLFRFEFAAAFAAGRERHASRFEPIDQTRNRDRTREWPGFLPWAIAEHYGKLKSGFSYLQTLEAFGGRPEEIENARANIVYVMGVMGHYVGDASQPLHTTKHFNGWVGDNPNRYTTWSGFHQWIDGGYIFKAGIGYRSLRDRARPARILFPRRENDDGEPAFRSIVDYVLEQHAEVEPLYRLDRQRKLQGGDAPVDPEGVAFIEEQLLRGAAMLSNLWLTAWKNAGEDAHLRRTLESRSQRE